MEVESGVVDRAHLFERGTRGLDGKALCGKQGRSAGGREDGMAAQSQLPCYFLDDLGQPWPGVADAIWGGRQTPRQAACHPLSFARPTSHRRAQSA